MTRTCSRRALATNRSIIAVAAAMAASLAFAGPEYPPGLFENSPLVPSGPPHAARQSEAPDADVPFEPPDPDAPFGTPDAVAPFGPPDATGRRTIALASPFGPFTPGRSQAGARAPR
jgi:hypothetical protein